MKRDERYVNLLINHAKNNMSDPFNVEGDQTEVLINISTGRHATPAVQNSLLNCVDIGEEKVDYFIQGVLDKTGDRNFHDPIKQTKLKTFSDMNKKVKIKTKTVSN